MCVAESQTVLMHLCSFYSAISCTATCAMLTGTKRNDTNLQIYNQLYSYCMAELSINILYNCLHVMINGLWLALEWYTYLLLVRTLNGLFTS